LEKFEVRECLLLLGARPFVYHFAVQNIKIYKIIIFPVVVYGCDTWSLTLGVERRLRVFEKRVLKTIFRPKRDEVTGEWKILHNDELNLLAPELFF